MTFRGNWDTFKKITFFFLPNLLVCWILKQISVPVQTDFYTVFEMTYDFSHVGIAFFFAGWVSLLNSWQNGWLSELMFMYVLYHCYLSWFESSISSVPCNPFRCASSDPPTTWVLWWWACWLSWLEDCSIYGVKTWNSCTTGHTGP